MKYWFIVLLSFFFIFEAKAQVLINEVQASNDTTLVDNFLEYDDWLELYNTTNISINLAGYYLSDDIFQLNKFQIPSTNATATTIPANGYLIFWVDNDEIQGENHTNFKLSSSGETVFLIDPDGVTIIDSLTYQPLTADQTYKRIPDGSNNVFKSKMASPGSTNNNDIGLLDTPVFSIAPGIYSSAQTVALSATNGATIYYTTNGDEPDLNSAIYSGPISISQNITIKAIAAQSNFASSEVVSAAYFTNANHTLPVLNISLDQKHLTDDIVGMYTVGTNGTLGGCNTTANWWNDFEYPAHITLFEKDGTVGFNEIAGVEISGGCSRNKDKKAFNVGFKSKYGNSKLKYKLYEDADIDTYDGFKIRAGGSNTDSEFTDDALAQKYIEGELDIDLQKSRPVVLYLNGDYWGLYFIRDRLNTGYVETYHTKYDDLPVDMIKNPYSNAGTSNVYYWVYEKVMSGSKTEYYNLVSYIENNDLSITSNYEYVKTQIEMDSFIDYLIPFIFYGKYDWPGNNLKVWKADHPTSKWRWMMFDMEWVGRKGVESLEMLNELLVSNDPPQLMHLESSTILKGLFENNEFKHEFIQRTNTYINSVWNTGRVQQLTNTLNNEIEPEVAQNNVRWSANVDYNTFQANKNQMVDYVTDRPPYWRTMVDNVLNVSGRITISYNFDSNTNGCILTNSNFYSIPENYSATYHKSIPLWIHAIPKPGYRFVEWQEISNTTRKYQQSFYSSFSGNKSLTPIFEPALDVVINEIHYNPLGTLETEEFIELYNPDIKAKPLYGYKFDNGVEFAFPESAVINSGEYIVIAKDASLYNGNGYQVFQWTCGSLNNDGEALVFSNPANEVIDSVYFNDNTQWNQSAHGLGFSLALLDNVSDNNLPASWDEQASGSPVTPGAKNDFCEPIQNSSTVFNISCFGSNDGFIVNNTTGGTNPLSYSWSNGQNNSIAPNLPAGMHILTITDAYNCTRIDSFIITEPVQLQATANVTNDSSSASNDGAIDIMVNGGETPYSFNWNNGINTEDINNLAAGNYSLSIIDANNCQLMLSDLQVGNNCLNNLVYANQPQHISGIYQVADYIESNGLINIDENVSFKANDFIELNNFFEVILGAEFEIKIDGCY